MTLMSYIYKDQCKAYCNYSVLWNMWYTSQTIATQSESDIFSAFLSLWFYLRQFVIVKSKLILRSPINQYIHNRILILVLRDPPSQHPNMFYNELSTINTDLITEQHSKISVELTLVLSGVTVAHLQL